MSVITFVLILTFGSFATADITQQCRPSNEQYLVADNERCDKFHMCDESGQPVAQFLCDDGMVFDVVSQQCGLQSGIDCTGRSTNLQASLSRSNVPTAPPTPLAVSETPRKAPTFFSRFGGPGRFSEIKHSSETLSLPKVQHQSSPGATVQVPEPSRHSAIHRSENLFNRQQDNRQAGGVKESESIRHSVYQQQRPAPVKETNYQYPVPTLATTYGNRGPGSIQESESFRQSVYQQQRPAPVKETNNQYPVPALATTYENRGPGSTLNYLQQNDGQYAKVKVPEPARRPLAVSAQVSVNAIDWGRYDGHSQAPVSSQFSEELGRALGLLG